MSDFGSRLKKARKDKNITQKELARVLGVAQSAIANYENNTRFPGLDILREISDFLNVSLDHLLGVEIKHENQTSQLLNKRDYQTLANEFMELLLDYREEQAKDLIKHVRSQGVMLTTIIQRIFIPVLYNIGIGWQRGEVSVAQEHYITAIIDRMIDFLSESQGVGPSLEFSSVFMSPGGEEHVLTLKMAAEFFKAAGWKTRFIGMNVPLDGLLEVIKEENASVLVMASLTVDGMNSAGYLISALRGILGNGAPLVLLGGRIPDMEILKKQINADFILDSFDKLPETIKNIGEHLINNRTAL